MRQQGACGLPCHRTRPGLIFPLLPLLWQHPPDSATDRCQSIARLAIGRSYSIRIQHTPRGGSILPGNAITPSPVKAVASTAQDRVTKRILRA